MFLISARSGWRFDLTEKMFDLQGKNALIMGGGNGTGFQAACALGNAGARVMLAGQNADELESAVQDLQDLGIDARWVQVGGSHELEWQRPVVQTLERMGDVHILVNHVNLVCRQAGWGDLMEGALRRSFALSQYVATHSMAALRQGSIINLVDVCRPGDNCELLTRLACKAMQNSVKQLTQSMAARWWSHGIRVNTIGVNADIEVSLQTEGIQGALLLFASNAGQQMTGQWLACGEYVDNGD